MKKIEKKNRVYLGLFLIVLLFLNYIFIPFISAQQIVEVPQEEAKSGNIFTAPFQIFKSRIFWGGVVIVVFVLVLIIGLFFLVRWVVKFIKSRSDAFWRLRTERMKLAKIHRRYPSKSWYKIHKNTPIRLVKKDKGRLIVTKPIGYHRGDYITHEGNFIISLNLEGNKKWFIYPITDLLIIPDKKSIDITQRDEKTGKREIMKMDNLPKPSDIVQFNENDILIFAESLSSVGMFLVPVLKDKDGEILDLSMPVFESLKQVVLGNYLYEQTAEFGTLSKQAMNLNPFVRASQKIADTSQSVDIPSSEERRR